MRQSLIVLFALIGTFVVDQASKALFLGGYYREGSCIDWALHLNKGVAFSMFAFLGEWLKWVQTVIVTLLAYAAHKEGFFKRYPFEIGILLGGAIGNLYDRFAHGAVVDFIAWHCGFTWPVFNIADVAIDLGVGLIVLRYLISRQKRVG